MPLVSRSNSISDVPHRTVITSISRGPPQFHVSPQLRLPAALRNSTSRRKNPVSHRFHASLSGSTASHREACVPCFRAGVRSAQAPVGWALRSPDGAARSRRRWSRRRRSRRRWSPGLPAFGCAGAAGVPLRCDVCPGAAAMSVLGCDVCSGAAMSCSGAMSVQVLFRSPAAMSCSGPVQVSACSGAICCRKHGRKHDRHTVESDHAPFYCPNSLTFIENLTGVDSVSHKVIGQKHSDKQLQENNPTCKKTTPL